MIVDVHRCVEATPELTGTVVVIDVFRASNTVLALLEAGAEAVHLVAGLDQARALKRDHPRWCLLGERGGIAPEGFDGNNSPAAAPALVGPGSVAILTTSAGTQALSRVRAAERVAFASFANAAAVVRWVRAGGADRVSLLAAGLSGREPATEDDLCAALLAAGLQGHHPPDPVSVRQELLASPGAHRLRRLGQDDDLELCLEVDRSTLVPVVLDDPPRAVPWLAGGHD